MLLKNRRIILAVTGSISAFKAISFMRELQKLGAEVRVAITHSGARLCSPETLEALSGNPVYQQIFDSTKYGHIDIAAWGECMVIYPCTAHTLAGIAAGFCDDPVTLTALAFQGPRILAPAMNHRMWHANATGRNLEALSAEGWKILNPEPGVLACGETGDGRLCNEADALDAVIDSLLPVAEHKGTVLITAGRTEEAIDPVRCITNKSSGKTALAVAHAFRAQGYRVTVVHGPCDVKIPYYLNPVPVTSALDMFHTTLELRSDAVVVVCAAAVADFRPAKASTQKIKASSQLLELKLERNPDILAELCSFPIEGQVVVGFALETESPIQNGILKMQKKGCPLMVVNNPVATDGSGFGADRVRYAVIGAGLPLPNELAMGLKEDLAEELVRSTTEFLNMQELR
jgi:phosphopantothenoylcysteine decarboxylase / phosphopantothenate---cysteine ligase